MITFGTTRLAPPLKRSSSCLMKFMETERTLQFSPIRSLPFGTFVHCSVYASTAIYTSMGGHVHTRLRSPYTLSIRPTVGQNLVDEFTQGAGNAVWGK